LPAGLAWSDDHLVVRIRIEGFDLPGLSCGPKGAGRRYDNVHVGVQRRSDVVDLVPGDAPSAEWSFEVTTRPGDSSTTDSVDIGGPFVHGRKGDRFLYLSWGTLDASSAFAMFRRAKLHLADVDPALIRSAIDGSHVLVARLPLTDHCGDPVCARVRPPILEWTVRRRPCRTVERTRAGTNGQKDVPKCHADWRPKASRNTRRLWSGNVQRPSGVTRPGRRRLKR
jgi:hypothetical protein